MAEHLVEIRGLSKRFPVTRGIVRRKVVSEVRAVDGIDLDIMRGETLGLVGESGCGKSTTGRLILGLLPPTSGSIRFAGKDIVNLRADELRQMRSRFQMIFQDPSGSLNPRMTVLDLVAEPLKIRGGQSRKDRQTVAMDLMQAVGLGTQHTKRYPHEFSGGQRQRIGIARSLSLNPELVVADEPVSSLDVSVQAQVINLMQDLQERFSLTYVFISHDLSVVHHIADRIAVMYLGRIVEVADKRQLFARPAHPYTRILLDAIPVSRPKYRTKRPLITGDLPAAKVATGCNFASRCPHAEDTCRREAPLIRSIDNGHSVACHRVETIELADPRSPASP